MWKLLTVLFVLACTAHAAVDQKRAEPFEIVFGLPHAAPETLEHEFWDISTPGSSKYLQHLSLEQVRSIVGASEDYVESVKDFAANVLRADGVKVSELSDTVTALFSSKSVVAANAGAWSELGLPKKTLMSEFNFDFVLRRDVRKPELKHAPRVGRSKNGGYTIPEQKKAYGIPTDLQATNETGLQMVWGPGTFGYSPEDLEQLKEEQCPLLNLSKVKFDTSNHGTPGGDNWGEGSLDVSMISTFGLNVNTLVSNTNTSSSTEEGNGFGQALLDFITQLSSRKKIPQVLSLSLGSLSAFSCDKLCSEAVKRGHTLKECNDYLQKQRQVCMFLSQGQVDRINAAFKILGARGVTVFGSSGDGGSHFSFQPFMGFKPIVSTLNKIACEFQFPVFPTTSPYVTSVGGTVWENDDASNPIAWSGSGGGFSWQFGRAKHQEEAVMQYLGNMNESTGFPQPSSFNNQGRAYPDLAAVSVDGTSQSSPTMAGIFSLIMDHRLNNNLAPLGFLGPRLYEVNQKYPGEAFKDVVDGNTKTSCDNGFGATKGWDPVTGWGRPEWDGLVKHFGEDSSA